jgi:cell division protein FtsL
VVPAPFESPARRRRRVRLIGALAGAFFVAVVFGLVWLHVVLAQNQFRLDRLDARVSDEQSQYERSRLQVDQLESPQRIVDTAEGKLGMVPPSTVIYLTPSAPPATTAPPGPTAPSTTLPAKPGPATVAAPAGHALTDWTSVKPLLVPRP